MAASKVGLMVLSWVAKSADRWALPMVVLKAKSWADATADKMDVQMVVLLAVQTAA